MVRVETRAVMDAGAERQRRRRKEITAIVAELERRKAEPCERGAHANVGKLRAQLAALPAE